MFKICSKCKIEKDISDFHKCYSRKKGVHPQCKVCRLTYLANNKEKTHKYGKEYRKNNKDKTRNYSLKRNYGITLEQKQQIYVKQNKKCAICPRYIETVNSACVDHEHTTGKIREILCRKCNSALGLLQDNPEICFAAGNYILKHRTT